MRCMLMFAVIAAAALAALGVGGTVAAPHSKAPVPKCIATGARYTAPGGSTKKYIVYPAGVTCAFPKPWVSRLTRNHQEVGSTFAWISGGPPGFSSDTGLNEVPHAFTGQCRKQKGNVTTASFSWNWYLLK